eukprot:m51a1_g9058 hypothetical protein (553) ;mRNA; f:62967-64699
MVSGPTSFRSLATVAWRPLVSAVALVVALSALGAQASVVFIEVQQDSSINGSLNPASTGVKLPRIFLVGTSSETASVVCSANLSFSDTPGSEAVAMAAGSSVKEGRLFTIRPDLNEAALHFGKTPAAEFVVDVGCRDTADGSPEARAHFAFKLGSCSEAPEVGPEWRQRCHRQSMGFCALCNDSCVPTSGLSRDRMQSCQACGNGVLDEGEVCDSTPFCARDCRCHSGNEGPERNKCGPFDPLQTRVRLAAGPRSVSYEQADRLVAALNASLLAPRHLMTQSVELRVRDSEVWVDFRVVDNASDSRLYAVEPNRIVREQMRGTSAYLVAALEAAGLHAGAGSPLPEVDVLLRPEAGGCSCGNGVVEGRERCDSSAFCEWTCECAAGSKATPDGRCSAPMADVFFQLHETVAADGTRVPFVLPDAAVHRFAANFEAQCLTLEASVFGKQYSASRRTVKLSVKSALFPGARTPLEVARAASAECALEAARGAVDPRSVRGLLALDVVLTQEHDEVSWPAEEHLAPASASLGVAAAAPLALGSLLLLLLLQSQLW